MSENTAKITDPIAESRNSCEHEPGVTCPNCKGEEKVSGRAMAAAKEINAQIGQFGNSELASIIDKHMRPSDKGWHLATEKPLSMVPLMVERNCGVSPLQAYYSAEHANFYCQTTRCGLGDTVMRWRYFDPAESRPAEPTSAEWKPCPWCGSDKITVEWELCPPLDATDTNRRWFAECTQCSCQGPFCQTEPQVKPAWNTRPPAQMVGKHYIKYSVEWKREGGHWRRMRSEWCDKAKADNFIATLGSDVQTRIIERSVTEREIKQ